PNAAHPIRYAAFFRARSMRALPAVVAPQAAVAVILRVAVEFSGQVVDGDGGKFCRFPPTLPANLIHPPPAGLLACRATMNLVHLPTQTFRRAPCASINRIRKGAARYTRRRVAHYRRSQHRSQRRWRM